MSVKLFFLLPIFEILIFVLFGDFFGFFPVIFSIIATGLLGVFFLKSGINPQNIISNPKEWVYKKIAGVLLIIPGFITDTFGILLLVRSLRFIIWDFIPERTKKHFHHDVNSSDEEEIIEVDYKDLDDK